MLLRLLAPVALAGSLIFYSCQYKTPADTLFRNAVFYTLDSLHTVSEALVVKAGKIVFTGSLEDAINEFSYSEEVDLKGRFVYPGFIDGHCHFTDYGLDLIHVSLKQTGSWEEVLERMSAHAVSHPEGWLIGRGWDQNDWSSGSSSAYPVNAELNRLFPDRPVFLERIDGHACIVNQAALDLAGFTTVSQMEGGAFLVKNSKLTGVLLDAAKDSMERVIPIPGTSQIQEALLKAQQNCFAVGLTTVCDAGLEKRKIEAIDAAHRSGKLKMRVYAMVADLEPDKQHFLDQGPYKTDRLNVRAIKYYSDGALGSRGALLLEPYSDASDHAGLQQKPFSYYEAEARKCLDRGFQMCTHAIGDSANRMMLRVYAGALANTSDKRWRIEHCQVVAPEDLVLFKDHHIIPSIQAIHATSDMPWAPQRLGSGRIATAYAYQSLLRQNGWITNGSDFPVEDINPLYGFYAAVARKDHEGNPKEGFHAENGLSRLQALMAMTLWAARAHFEENEKGSLECGKLADFTVLDLDLLSAPEMNLFSARVLATYVDGEVVYTAPEAE